MRERGVRRRVVVATALVAAGVPMLACGGDAPRTEGTPAPGSPHIAFTFGIGDIYAVRADGSGRVRLTRGAVEQLGGTGDSAPAWSPDGTKLVFVRTRSLGFEDFRSQVYLLGPGGGQPRPLTAGADGVSVYDPIWSPDGQRIAFVRSTETESALVVVEVDGSGEWILRSEPYDIEGPRNHLWDPAWSPDGTRIAYTLRRLDRRYHFRPALYVMAADGGDARLLARDAGDAAWSPDGRRIAFVSVRDRNGKTCYDQCSYHGELYVMDADGTNEIRLTRNRGDETSPTWSPDGRRIGFASDRNYPEGSGQEIYSIRPNGRCLTWLTNGSPGSGEPAWRNVPRTTSDPGRCGATHRRPLVRTDLRRIRRFGGHPVYWFGRRHGNLLLSYGEAGRDVGLVYSDCASFRPRACPEPIQLQETSVCSRRTTLSVVAQPHYRPMRVFASRGLLFVDIGQGDLGVIIGRTHVRIFPDARSRRSANRRALAAAHHLRPFGKRAARLPPSALPRALLVRMRRTERAFRRLDSIDAVARALGIPSLQVRRRLRLASVVHTLPHVRAVACRHR
jgi:WD40-like Beta Propeller Repeat